MIRSKEVGMEIRNQEANRENSIHLPLMVNDRLSAVNKNDSIIKDGLQSQELTIKQRLEQRRKNNFQKCTKI